MEVVELLMARHELPADELALLAAIHEQPRQSSHRFAYADWLAGHGEPDLADLIQRQCKPPDDFEHRLQHPLAGRADEIVAFGRDQLDDAELAKPLSGAAARTIVEAPFVGRFSHVMVAGDMEEEAAAIFREQRPFRFTTSTVRRKRAPRSPKA